MAIDFKKVVKNIDIISGTSGLKTIYKAPWCVGEAKEILLEYIANKYGFILDEEGNKEISKYKKDKTIICNTNNENKLMFLAQKLKVPVNKIKQICDNKYLIFGKFYSEDGKEI